MLRHVLPVTSRGRLLRVTHLGAEPVGHSRQRDRTDDILCQRRGSPARGRGLRRGWTGATADRGWCAATRRLPVRGKPDELPPCPGSEPASSRASAAGRSGTVIDLAALQLAALRRRRAALQLVHSWRYVRGYGKLPQPADVRP